ncbi:hypothetical protein [Sphingopyxis sp.]|uniref:hypothetical protein n=1 Tax=Sphingopyxis sp. TaxID=1908224 RepID=UPI003D6CD52F
MAELASVGWKPSVADTGTIDFSPIGGVSGGPVVTVPSGSGNGADTSGSAFVHPVDIVPQLVPYIGWKGGGQDWDGEHRDAKRATVTFSYKLRWVGDRLTFEVSNTPADRNYVLYLVVEEFLPRSGQWLHTAIPVPVHGCLTYVPQSFFDREAAAFAEAGKAIADFYRRLPVDVDIGRPIPDPVFTVVRPGDLSSRRHIIEIVGREAEIGDRLRSLADSAPILEHGAAVGDRAGSLAHVDRDGSSSGFKSA